MGRQALERRLSLTAVCSEDCRYGIVLLVGAAAANILFHHMLFPFFCNGERCAQTLTVQNI